MGLLVALAAAGASAQGIGGIDDVGPYPTGYRLMVVSDPSRATGSGFHATGRKIPVHLFYPADAASAAAAGPAQYVRDAVANPGVTFSSELYEARGIDPALEQPAPAAGPFPLVTFSHGLNGTWIHYLYLATRLASHGFVVAMVSHSGENTDLAIPFDGIDAARQYSARRALDPRVSAALQQFNRPLDVSFAIEALLARSQTPGDALQGLVDPDRIAAAGHSLGGHTAMQLAMSHHPRIKAVVGLDASAQLFTFAQMADIVAPLMSIGRDPASRELVSVTQRLHGPRLHAAVSSRPNYRVDLERSNHNGSLTGLCQELLVMRDLGWHTAATANTWLNTLTCLNPFYTPYAEAQSIVQRYALAFLETELAGDTRYQRILTPGWALTAETRVHFFVTERMSNDSAHVADTPDAFRFFLVQPGSEHEGAHNQEVAEKDPPFVEDDDGNLLR